MAKRVTAAKRASGARAPKKQAAAPRPKAKATKAKATKARRDRVAAAIPTKRLGDALANASTAQPFLADQILGRAPAPIADLPNEIRQSIEALRPQRRSFHGAKFSLAYFPTGRVTSPCADMFGYMSSASIRAATSLPFDPPTISLLDQLGALMADAGRDTPQDSTIPAGFTYVGQFVDHDITLDVSSSLQVPTDANTIHNMRTPALDLDSVYGDGPALHPFLYDLSAPNPTAIKMRLGTNLQSGAGGPSTPALVMPTHGDFDVPRMLANPHTAVIGDPRNDENLIVVQFHHAMLRFHNAVVDQLVASGFAGDVFVEAKRLVTHHYQLAVVDDFLTRICGAQAVADARAQVNVAVGTPFRMPVEFAVAAYRFGHSMVRDQYFVNLNFPQATMAQVFEFNRVPHLPVRSNWVVDFNAFFETGKFSQGKNMARPIDSVLANELEKLPGFNGIMAILATRNLRRGLALGLPSGQGMAQQFRLRPLSPAQLKQGLPANEVALLDANGGLLSKKTPLWYYVLREAAVLHGGNQLGPVGARIVAQTFVRLLKRDAGSFLNAPGFVPTLANGPTFTFADLVNIAGVTTP